MRDKRGSPERFLTTVVMTDIVGSTEHAAELGDSAWRELLQQHHALIRAELRRHGGREIDTAGDGFFVVFDAPATAVRCVLEIAQEVGRLGIEIRAGVHVGEVQQMAGKVTGIAVVVASRIMANAGGGEVLVSSTVRDLAAGSGLTFDDRGVRTLKGVPGEWHVFAVGSAEAQTAEPGQPVAASERRAAAVRRAQARPFWQRHPRATAAMAVGLVAVLGISSLVVWSPWRPPALEAVAANALGLIDPDRNEIIGQVDVGQQPSAVGPGEDGIWVANSIDGTVQRIDSDQQLVVHTVDVGLSPIGLVVANGSVWVANSGGRSVSRINIETGRVVDTITVGNSPSAIAAGASAIWVTNRGDGTVMRLDGATGEPMETIPVGFAPSGLAVDDFGVWVISEDGGTLVHLDPATGVALAPPIPVGSRPVAIATGAGAVWVASATDGTVTRIDPQADRVNGVIEVGGGLSALVVADDNVWVAGLDGVVHRLEVADLDTTPVTISTGSGISALTPTDEGIWFAAVPRLDSHRGGVLRVAVSGQRGTLTEPIFTPQNMLVWSLVGDGLVTYPRRGGVAGARLVPGLAASMPTISDGGLTLTFRLRPGLVYSDGRPVGPEDFRYAIERLFQVEDPLFGGPRDGPFFFAAIRDADACMDAPVARCDLSGGIVTDATAGTITFHLSAPDPAFLAALATVFPIPGDAAPPNEMAAEPIRGTGPYMFVEYDEAQIRLVRNPNFESWNQFDRPDGFVGEIVVALVSGDPVEATSMVERGEADHVMPHLDAERISELRVQYPAQLHFNPSATTAVFMDTSRPPFDSLEARQGVNLALDRALLAEMRGGTFAAAPTCQMVPPNFPGYQPYCPWTVDPDAGGQWSGPDIGEAQRLIDQSGTRGAQFVIGPLHPRFNAEVGPYLVTVLEELGYDVSLETVDSFEEYFEAVFVEQRVHVGILSFLAGSPSPDSFLSATCADNVGLSNYCDPELDERIGAARSLELTDPAAAVDAWAAIDRELSDLALNAPIVTEGTSFVSARVRNFQNHLLWGMLLDQAWVE